MFLKTLFLLLAMFVMEVSANEIVSDKKQGVVVLSTAEDFAPYAYQTSEQQWKGIDYEIVRHLFDILGFKIDIIPIPRARNKNLLETNQIDGVLSTAAFVSGISDYELWYSDTLYTTNVAAFSLVNLSINQLSDWRQTAQLKNLIVGYIHGLEVDLTNQSHVQAYRDTQLLKLLILGRVHISISDELSFYYAARGNGVHEEIQYLDVVKTRDVSLGLSERFLEREKLDPLLINKEINKLKNKGVMDTAIIKYLSVVKTDNAEKE